MLKRLKTVSMMLFLMGTTTGAAFAAPSNGVDDVKITQQSETATGVVKDALGETVIGASVIVKGTTNGTITDFDGNFSLPNVKKGDIIQISFVGYQTQEIAWNGTPLTVTLSDDTQALDEVVVTALGMKRSTKALGYAMTEMKGEDLNANVMNPVSALQGKVAGVDISGADGGLFGSAKILIRGASTLNANNQPIYVVDGVILDNSVKNGDADWSDTDKDWGNELKNLNPDDFETVSVLKGAAATALYGSRGLNGAVVITTKSGKGKKGLGIRFSQTFGIDHVYAGPDFQNKYGPGQYAGNVFYEAGNQWDTNQFKFNGNGDRTMIGVTTRHFGPAFDGKPIEDFDYKMRPYSPIKDNFTDAYDNGFNTNTNVAVQGGNETTNFYTSLSYKYASGTTPNNTFDRLSFLAKASHKLTDKVEIEAGISFANSNPKGGEVNLGEKFADGTWGRMYDTRYWRNRYKGNHGGMASTDYGDEYGYAPGKGTWWMIYENEYTQKETSVRPSLKITADLTDWLKLSVEGNYNYYFKRNEAKELGTGYANDGGYYRLQQYQKEQTNLNANLTFNKTMGDWTVNGFLRGEYYNNFQQEMSINTNGGLIVPGQFFINNSKNTAQYSGKISGEKTILSAAFQAGVSWKDQVFLDVTGRNDWSSAMVYSDETGNFSFFYPSVSGSWLVHQTLRDQLPEWISFMKLRGSWAQVGNDTDAYIINSAYSIVSSTTAAGNTYALDLPKKKYATDLKPERKTSWEIGLDWRFLENRIGLDFTYYKENTKDQIMSIAVPHYSGITEELVNAGNIQNSGVEIALNTTPIENKDWTWDLNFTFSKNVSKIVELHENVADFITLTGMSNYGNYRIASTAKVGGAYGLLMSDSAPKIDKATGLPILDVSYYNYNNMHAVFNQRSGAVEEVGSMQPDFLAGINTSLRYKNWTLRAQLDARFGGYVASYNNRYGTAYGFFGESMKWRDSENGGMTFTSIWDNKTYHDGMIPNGIIEGGTELNLPGGGTYKVKEGGETYESLYKAGVVDPQHGTSWTYWNNAWSTGTINDSWFKELNYIALREVSLSYNVPSSFAKKLGANSLNITASGRNLGYLLNSLPDNMNPESVRGTSASQFMIRSVSPYVASYTLTINATF